MTDKVLTVSTERSLISYATLVFIPVLAATRFQVKDAMNVRGPSDDAKICGFFEFHINRYGAKLSLHKHFENSINNIIPILSSKSTN